MTSARPWTEAERWTLAALWDGHGKWWDGWAKALPGRTPDAIADQAQAMGLTWKRPRDKWTPEEDACLLRHIMEVSQETGRAPSSVASRVAGLRRSAKRADAERTAMRWANRPESTQDRSKATKGPRRVLARGRSLSALQRLLRRFKTQIHARRITQ